MKITVDLLEGKRACADGLAWFKEKFGTEGDGAEYQAVLDRLAQDGKDDWAHWLLDAVGPTRDVVKIKGDLEGRSFFFAGSVEVEGRVQLKGFFRAGSGISAGEGIKAGWGISAGLAVRCKKVLSFRFNLFAGIATWKKASLEEQEVECSAIEGGGNVKSGLVKTLAGKKA